MSVNVDRLLVAREDLKFHTKPPKGVSNLDEFVVARSRQRDVEPVFPRKKTNSLNILHRKKKFSEKLLAVREDWLRQVDANALERLTL